MISNPYLIFYTSVSRDSTILAEFNSKDADLGTLAAKCLEKAPPLHSYFSHTVRNRTHTFLIDDPFVYFAIFHEDLESSEGLAFLRSVRDAFNAILDSDGVDRARDSNFSSRCFQGEFSPVFHQLLATPVELDTPQSPRSGLGMASPDSPRSRTAGSATWLGGAVGKCLKKKKKKNKRSVSENNGGSGRKDAVAENKVDISGNMIGLSREISLSMQKNGLFAIDVGRQKGIWKKQLWIVLSLDLIVCSIMFGVWLWICRGFRCVNG